MLLLSVGEVLKRRVPMTRWAWVLGRSCAVPDAWRGRRTTLLRSRAASRAEGNVAVAVRRAAARLPWEPTCLAEAFAGQVMLRRRHEPGAVVIGLRRPAEPDQPWDAHAWLVGRLGALTGGPAARGFTATAVFTPDPDWAPGRELDERV
ncbi:MAG: hypothetical protein JWO76_385 [Nocardioides sp.]|nr:hypothetical protein [Nocardioides sp.]